MTDRISSVSCFIYPNDEESGDSEGGLSWTNSQYVDGYEGVAYDGLNGTAKARVGFADGDGYGYELPESGTDAVRSLDGVEAGAPPIITLGTESGLYCFDVTEHIILIHESSPTITTTPSITLSNTPSNTPIVLSNTPSNTLSIFSTPTSTVSLSGSQSRSISTSPTISTNPSIRISSMSPSISPIPLSNSSSRSSSSSPVKSPVSNTVTPSISESFSIVDDDIFYEIDDNDSIFSSIFTTFTERTFSFSIDDETSNSVSIFKLPFCIIYISMVLII